MVKPMDKLTAQTDEGRSRRNIVLAVAHVVLAAVILAAFVIIQMQSSGS